MTRVFVFRWTPAETRKERYCRERWTVPASQRKWTQFINRRGVLGFYASEPGDVAPLILPDEQGAIFGPMFDAEAPGVGPMRSLGSARVRELIEGDSDALMTRFWGQYCAVLHDRFRDTLRAVREPTGSAPLYVGPLGDALAVFSHASDYIAVAEHLEADLDFLSAFIAHARLVTPRTAISGVREILGGEEIIVPRRLDRKEFRHCWSPLSLRAQRKLGSFDATAQELLQTVLMCARSWAGVRPRTLHRLSGGLDSSIALAALVAGGADVTAINEFAPDVPEGDERIYARAAAAKFGVPLLEVEMSPANVDYARLLSSEVGAKPSRAEMGATDATIASVIAERDAEALVASGQGGDQVFHRSRLPIIAADAWQDGVGVGPTIDIALDTARLCRRPVWEVLSSVVKHGIFRRPYSPGGPLRNVRLLDGGRGAHLAEEINESHPLACELKRTPPARALRALHIMDLQYYHQRCGLNAAFLTAPVLASQPIVELCLEIPPYVMTKGGRERALVRAAFGSLLPDNIQKRTGKGDTTRYHTAIVEKQLPFMREMLLGGELERGEVVDLAALQTQLSTDVITSASVTVAASSALLAEIWLRRFDAPRAAAVAFRKQIKNQYGAVGDEGGAGAPA